MEKIYLDHAATTPLDGNVYKVMNEIMLKSLGNSSSTHYYGRQARQELDQARTNIARLIRAKENEIIFTSGGTESDNLALVGVARANEHKGKHIITSATEHHAVLNTLHFLEENGFTVTYLIPDELGRISVSQIKEVLTNNTILVSIMYINNETGVAQNIKSIAKMLSEHQAYFHTDAVQAFGVQQIDVVDLGIDLLSMTAHKVNGPQGVGFLYCKESIGIKGIQFGGEQERRKRAGTENISGIVGLEKALESIVLHQKENKKHFIKIYELFIKCLKESSIEYKINGDRKHASPAIINVSFPNTKVEQLLMNFDIVGISVSSGSACTAGTEKPSHVLVAMYGEKDARIYNSIRFSFGKNTTENEIHSAGEKIVSIVQRLQTS